MANQVSELNHLDLDNGVGVITGSERAFAAGANIKEILMDIGMGWQRPTFEICSPKLQLGRKTCIRVCDGRVSSDLVDFNVKTCVSLRECNEPSGTLGFIDPNNSVNIVMKGNRVCMRVVVRMGGFNFRDVCFKEEKKNMYTRARLKD
jgi:hypothetical protein